MTFDLTLFLLMLVCTYVFFLRFGQNFNSLSSDRMLNLNYELDRTVKYNWGLNLHYVHLKNGETKQCNIFRRTNLLVVCEISTQYVTKFMYLIRTIGQMEL